MTSGVKVKASLHIKKALINVDSDYLNIYFTLHTKQASEVSSGIQKGAFDDATAALDLD
jgi:hypothetical protein